MMMGQSNIWVFDIGLMPNPAFLARQRPERCVETAGAFRCFEGLAFHGTVAYRQEQEEARPSWELRAGKALQYRRMFPLALYPHNSREMTLLRMLHSCDTLSFFINEPPVIGSQRQSP